MRWSLVFVYCWEYFCDPANFMFLLASQIFIKWHFEKLASAHFSWKVSSSNLVNVSINFWRPPFLISIKIIKISVSVEKKTWLSRLWKIREKKSFSFVFVQVAIKVFLFSFIYLMFIAVQCKGKFSPEEYK